jgi:hypothetical protein
MVLARLLVIGVLLWLLMRRQPLPQPETELEPFDRLLLRFYIDSSAASARRNWSESSLDRQIGVLQRMIDWGWIGPPCGRVSVVSESEMAILDILGAASISELNKCLDGDEEPRRLPHRIAQAELARREAERAPEKEPT